MKSKHVKVLAIPFFNMGESSGVLPIPTKENTGGLPDYSPIDLAVAFLNESLNPERKKIYNLKKWFKDNPYRLSENLLHIVIKTNIIQSLSITEIKNLCKLNPEYLSTLKKLAPFTFKE